MNTSGYNDININIYVPLTYKNNIKINSISGDCKITGGDLENVTINSNSGEIQLKNLTSKTLKLQTTSNDIDLSDIKSLNSTLNTSTGDIKVSVSSLGKLSSSTSSEKPSYILQLGDKSTISSTSGDIDLFINESIGYALVFSTSSGNIDSDRLTPTFLNNNNYSVTNGCIGSKKVEVKTTSGELYVR